MHECNDFWGIVLSRDPLKIISYSYSVTIGGNVK